MLTNIIARFRYADKGDRILIIFLQNNSWMIWRADNKPMVMSDESRQTYEIGHCGEARERLNMYEILWTGEKNQ